MRVEVDTLVLKVAVQFAQKETERLGEVSVDSGTIVIMDPAYIKHWETGEHPDLSYQSVVDGKTRLHFNNGALAAVVVRTIGGDGEFPLTGSLTEDGRVWNVSLYLAKTASADTYFKVGDLILYGKYKNKKGRIVGMGADPKGNPTIEIEPIPKGRKKNKVMGLYKIWKDPLAERVASLYLEATAASKADATLSKPIQDKALALLIEQGKRFQIQIESEGDRKLVVSGPEEMKPKEITQAFEKAWGNASVAAFNDNEIPRPHGLGLTNKPKLDFSKYTTRDQSGKYMHTKWTRLCKCGHPVGIHAGEKSQDGSQPCFAPDYGIDCDCEKFRPTQKFMDEAEYKAKFGM